MVETRSENSGIASANPVEYIRKIVEMELIHIFGPEYQKLYQENDLGSNETEAESSSAAH